MFRAVTALAIVVASAWSWPAGSREQAAPQQPATSSIRGSLTYLVRVALSADSRAVVELRDVAAPPDAPPVAEQRIELRGRQVPIPFALTVDRTKLSAGHAYTLRGRIESAGRPRWTSDDFPVSTAEPQVDIGPVTLTQVQSVSYKGDMTCGTERISVILDGDTARVTVAGQVHEMKSVRAASGVKFEVPGDPATSFWSKGRLATLVVAGKTYPECTPAPPLAWTPFTAGGHEPGWHLDARAGRMTLSTESDGNTTTIAAPKVEAVPGGRRYSGSAGGHTIAVTVLDTVCTDTMTGMPRPNTVEVARDGKALEGCGGDPAALLRGQPWSVTDINGSALVERSRIVISFGATGRVSGNASCNGFGGTYTVTGEGLRFGETVATKRACLGPLMQQEAAFLGALGAVTRFDIPAGGVLVLHTADGGTITATRLKPPSEVVSLAADRLSCLYCEEDLCSRIIALPCRRC